MFKKYIFNILIIYIFFLSIRFLDLLLKNDFLIQSFFVLFSVILYSFIYLQSHDKYPTIFVKSFFLILLLQFWFIAYNLIIGLSTSMLLSNIVNYSAIILIALFSLQKDNFFEQYFINLGIVLTISLILYILLPSLSYYFVVGKEGGSIIEQSNRYCSVFNSPGYLALFSIALLIYSINGIFENYKLYFLIFYLVSFISGILTINRSFIILFILTHLIFFIYKFKKIKKIAIFIVFLILIYLFTSLFLKSFTFDLFDIFLIRFDSGFENRITGDSGINYSIKSIKDLNFIFGNLDYINGELWVNNNGNLEQPHNGFIFYLVGYGLFPMIFILMMYYLRFKYIFITKNYFILIFTLIFLLFSISEIFLIEQLNILIFFKIITELVKKNKHDINRKFPYSYIKE